MAQGKLEELYFEVLGASVDFVIFRSGDSASGTPELGKEGGARPGWLGDVDRGSEILETTRRLPHVTREVRDVC